MHSLWFILLWVFLVQSDLERHHAQKLRNSQHFRAAMAGRGAGRNVLNGQPKELSDRKGEVEGRLDRVETTLEFSESYRRVRIEYSRGLADLWTRIDSREVPGSRIKDEAAKIIEDEVKSQLSKQVVEDQVQAKSQELSRGKRSLPTHDARLALAQSFTIRPYLEWVSRPSRRLSAGFGLRGTHTAVVRVHQAEH